MFFIPITLKLTAKSILYAWHEECSLNCSREDTALTEIIFSITWKYLICHFQVTNIKYFMCTTLRSFLINISIYRWNLCQLSLSTQMNNEDPLRILYCIENKNTKFPYRVPILKIQKVHENFKVRILKGFWAIIPKYLPKFIAVSSP